MSAPPSPKLPVLVESVTVAGPGLTLLEPVVSTLSKHQEALMKIVTDLIAEKPKSPAEALELLGTPWHPLGPSGTPWDSLRPSGTQWDPRDRRWGSRGAWTPAA